MKMLDNPRSVLFQAEFCPMLFMLTEMLWFDTKFDLYSCFHSLPLIAALLGNLWRVALSPNGKTVEPAVLIHFKEGPAATLPQFWMCLYVYPLHGLPLVLFYQAKMWIYSKIPVIKERLQIRTECIEIFRKRQTLNKFLPKEKLEGRKSSMRGAYSTIGRKSLNRQSMMRRTKMGQS